MPLQTQRTVIEYLCTHCYKPFAYEEAATHHELTQHMSQSLAPLLGASAGNPIAHAAAAQLMQYIPAVRQDSSTKNCTKKKSGLSIEDGAHSLHQRRIATGAVKRKNYAPKQMSETELTQVENVSGSKFVCTSLQSASKKVRFNEEPSMLPFSPSNDEDETVEKEERVVEQCKERVFGGYKFRSIGRTGKRLRLRCSGNRRYGCKVNLYTDLDQQNAHLGREKQHTHAPDDESRTSDSEVAASENDKGNEFEESTLPEDKAPKLDLYTEERDVVSSSDESAVVDILSTSTKTPRPPCLVIDGYRFRNKGRKSNSDRIRYYCLKKGCPVRLTTDANRQDILFIGNTTHTCEQRSSSPILPPILAREQIDTKLEPSRIDEASPTHPDESVNVDM